MNNWCRYSLTVIIFGSLLAQHAGKLLLVADYYANKASYMAKCENKFRPALHCNGQCLLMKKMERADKKDTQTPEKKLEWKFEVLSRKTFYSPVAATCYCSSRQYFVPLSTGTPIDSPHSFFHPPAVV